MWIYVSKTDLIIRYLIGVIYLIGLVWFLIVSLKEKLNKWKENKQSRRKL